MHGGRYPAWGTSPEWNEVLAAKETLELCRLFTCPPSHLDGEDYHELQVMQSIDAAERNYQNAERKSRERRDKRRGR